METTALIELPIEYGTISLGERRARISCKLYRSNIPDHCCPECGAVKLEEYLVWKRLTGCLKAHPRGVHCDPMPGMPDDSIVLECKFDVKTYTAHRDSVNFGLSMRLDEMEDVASLTLFPKRGGKLIIESVEDMPDEEEEE